ncbi:MAG: glycosyltransferase family 1 protein [Nitrospirae bacterium]|nr:glycosyltransferase family 1 protein [Nitrospirota bacterium]
MGKTLRLTVVSETYLPQVNGVSKTLHRLVDHAEKRGCAVQRVIPRYPGVREEPETVAVGSVGWPGYRDIRVISPYPASALERIAAFRPDLIHVATEGPLGWAALRFARRRGTPVVSSFHTRFDLYIGHYLHAALTPAAWRYLRWFHNRCLRTYCPAESLQAVLEEKGIRRTAIWSRGVSTDRFHPRPRNESLLRSLGIDPGERVLLFSGRLAPEKNLPFLLKAFRETERWRPPVRLILVGDGPERERLHRTAPAGTVFAGYRNDEDLADLYASADLFVFPSLTETFGNVVLEALASGLPVVAFRSGGVADLLKGDRGGLLVDPERPERFLPAVNALLTDERARRRLAETGTRYAKTRDWDTIFDHPGVGGRRSGSEAGKLLHRVNFSLMDA